MLRQLTSWLHRGVLALWYSKVPVAWLFWPLSWLFGYLVRWRRRYYQQHPRAVFNPPVPLIVVGNISVGGTGKTPLIIWLIERLVEHGYRPGVISRGYGGAAGHTPHQVQDIDRVDIVGDEPLMIFQRTRVPVVVSPDRSAAASFLLENTAVDIILSDDGLQHYRLGRCMELAVVDGERGFGNGLLLPAGPLREPIERLSEADAVIVNLPARGANVSARYATIQHQVRPARCFQMHFEVGRPVSLNAQSDRVTTEVRNQVVESIAGIGNPQRFFNTLDDLGYVHNPTSFPDHHHYSEADLQPFQDRFILTTEKDAVKLRHFSRVTGAYLPISARLQDGLIDVIIARVSDFKQRQRSN